jgi:hypothetical protein
MGVKELRSGWVQRLKKIGLTPYSYRLMQTVSKAVFPRFRKAKVIPPDSLSGLLCSWFELAHDPHEQNFVISKTRIHVTRHQILCFLQCQCRSCHDTFLSFSTTGPNTNTTDSITQKSQDLVLVKLATIYQWFFYTTRLNSTKDTTTIGWHHMLRKQFQGKENQVFLLAAFSSWLKLSRVECESIFLSIQEKLDEHLGLFPHEITKIIGQYII